MRHPIESYVENPLVHENPFRAMQPDLTTPPSFEEARSKLPQPHWLDHEAAIECYWKTWEIGFSHLLQPSKENRFVSPYLDTAFNGHLFMWDSAFAMHFGMYGSRAFNFQRTLDNLYCKQHPDGYICREIDEADGRDCFERFDPSSTGPNVLPWTEWNYFVRFGDRQRLARIFPALLAYTQWFHTYHTWQDGSYWTTGWGCGMDNIPRMEPGYHPAFSHGRMRWIDASLQAVLAADVLNKMAHELGRERDVTQLLAQSDQLASLINETLWDERTGFYYDCFSNGKLSSVMHIGAYWALVAGIVPEDRLDRFVAHLDNPAEFNRPHRVPALAANQPAYSTDGDYWNGGIWAPTDYMVLKGLRASGYGSLAHLIALNHLKNVVQVFEDTGTVWENYAPEESTPGSPAKPDFVGWTGLPPIAVLLEEVFGLQPDVPNQTLLWDVRLQDEFGVENYPFGSQCVLNLKCGARESTVEKPVITAKSNLPLTLKVRWSGGEEVISLHGS